MSGARSPQVGDLLPPLVKPAIRRLQLVKYAGASNDFNPIHVDEEFARKAGYPSVFAHGMLSMGFLGELVKGWAGSTALRRLSVRFKAITWPGDVVTCRGEVVAVRREGEVSLADVKLWATTQGGTVTVEGNATVTVR